MGDLHGAITLHKHVAQEPYLGNWNTWALEASASEAGQAGLKQWVFSSSCTGRGDGGWNHIPEFSIIIFDSDIE